MQTSILDLLASVIVACLKRIDDAQRQAFRLLHWPEVAAAVYGLNHAARQACGESLEAKWMTVLSPRDRHRSADLAEVLVAVVGEATGVDR